MKKIAIFNLLIGLCLTACVEEIDIQPSESKTLIVVDGTISNELKRHEIILTTSGDFNDTSSYKKIKEAEVSINDGSNTFFLSMHQPGLYLTDSIQGEPGKVYTLNIQYQGQIYQAKDTMPMLPSRFEPVTFVKDRQFTGYEFRRHQFGFSHANKWELFIVRESIDSLPFEVNIDRLGLQIGVEVFPPLTYRFTYFTHPNIEVNGLLNFEIPHFYGFNPGFKVVQKKYNLSPQYYGFLRSLFMETEWRGTLFPSTPANIQGNISNGGLGFFSACSVKSLSFTPE